MKYLFVTGVCRLLSLLFAPFLRPPSSPFSASSILVLKPCCIGDVLMATAAVGQLRRAFPGAHIAFAAGSWAKEVVAHNPHVDEILDAGQVGARSPRAVLDYFTLLARLRARRFQAALVLDRSPLITLLPLLAGIPQRAGLDSGGRGFSLSLKVAVPSPRHEAELYLDTLRALGIPLQQPRLEFLPSQEDEAWAAAVLAPLPKRRIVAIHPGGGVNPGGNLVAKRWPPRRFGQVAQRLLSYGAAVVLVGGTGDRPAGELVLANVGSGGDRLTPALLDLMGKTSLGQLGAVLRRCHLFLGNDSGPLHLAVAVGTPVVALYGPSNPEVYGPYTQDRAVLYKAPAGSLPLAQGDALAYTMEAITAEEVWEALVALLERKKDASI